MSANFPHLVSHVPDAPLQEYEIRALPRCANCPFAAPDKDDGKLYCHESSVRAQPVVMIQPPKQNTPVLTAQGGLIPPKPEVVVLGVTSFWPEVQPEWACWRHPRRQAERRRLESGL